MKCVKNTVLFLLLAVFTFSCSENSFTSTHPEAELNSSHKKSNTTAQSSQTVRYDNFSNNMEFVVTDRRWHHYNLTYYFTNGTSDITGDQEKQAIEDAIDLWAAETDFSFREVSSESNADIVILWATGAHGDGSAFDGTNGILAHAFLPPSYNTTSYAGDVHFDDAETWTLSTRPNNNQPMDLVTVAAHELGHSLGLGHSQYSSALMAPFYTGSHRFLSQDDKNGIDALYPLEVSITGSPYVNSSQTGSFTGDVFNEEGSISYQWYYRVYPNQSWIKDTGATNSSYNRTFYNTGGYQDQAVKLEVTSAGETASKVHSVDVYGCQQGVNTNSASTNIIIPC